MQHRSTEGIDFAEGGHLETGGLRRQIEAADTRKEGEGEAAQHIHRPFRKDDEPYCCYSGGFATLLVLLPASI
jgi:hypothetical protein